MATTKEQLKSRIVDLKARSEELQEYINKYGLEYETMMVSLAEYSIEDLETIPIEEIWSLTKLDRAIEMAESAYENAEEEEG